MRILLTGGRAPATLELARLLYQAGHRVEVAESLPWSLSSWSRAVARTHRVPAPVAAPEAFLAALAAIGADRVIPTCEEVFWVARGALPALVDPLPALRELHSKWSFVQLLRAHGLPAPATARLTSPADVLALRDRWPALVFKPEFSRFATRTLVRPRDASAIRPSATDPWVAQDFVPGRVLCTWGVAHQGRLAVHACYASEHRAGLGSSVHFRALDRPDVRDLVARLAAARGLTGHVALDLVDGPDGPVPIECNPRLTSGVHLFADQPEALAAAVLGQRDGVLEPTGRVVAQLSAPMWLYGLPRCRSLAEARRWAVDWWEGRDVAMRGWDPLPALGQVAAMAVLLGVAARRGIDPLAASTVDIEWNGT